MKFFSVFLGFFRKRKEGSAPVAKKRLFQMTNKGSAKEAILRLACALTSDSAEIEGYPIARKQHHAKRAAKLGVKCYDPEDVE